MKRIIILLGCVLALILIARCNRKNHQQVASVTFRSAGEESVSISIPKSWDQPWRLRFGSPDLIPGQSSPSDKVTVHLRNDDHQPLAVNMGRSTAENITIAPGSTAKIFDGTLDQLLIVGRREQEELTLDTTGERTVNVTMKFTYDTQYKELEIYVLTWFLRYGL